MPASTTYCAEHTDTPTSLRCSRCEKLVCPQCMVQAPVGIRCREHGQGAKLPTYQVSRGYLARGIGAGVAIGVAGGAALAFVVLPLVWSLLSGFGTLIALAGFGYLLGEGISRATNRKRGRPLVIVAVASVLIAFGIIFFSNFGITQLSELLGMGAAIYLAITRLR